MTYLIVFSPTGTSRKIGEFIVRGIGGEVVTIDLTYAPAPALNISKEDFGCVCSPGVRWLSAGVGKTTYGWNYIVWSKGCRCVRLRKQGV